MAHRAALSRVPEIPEASLPEREDVQLVSVQTMRPDAGSPETVDGNEGRLGVPDSADAPVTLKVDFWYDREPDVDPGHLPPWLAAAVLQRASELMYDMAEADWEEATDEEEEEE